MPIWKKINDNNKASLDTFLDKIYDYASVVPVTHTRLSGFLKWKFIERLRFEDINMASVLIVFEHHLVKCCYLSFTC